MLKELLKTFILDQTQQTFPPMIFVFMFMFCENLIRFDGMNNRKTIYVKITGVVEDCFMLGILFSVFFNSNF